jgi:hypothetical protein
MTDIVKLISDKSMDELLRMEPIEAVRWIDRNMKMSRFMASVAEYVTAYAAAAVEHALENVEIGDLRPEGDH